MRTGQQRYGFGDQAHPSVRILCYGILTVVGRSLVGVGSSRGVVVVSLAVGSGRHGQQEVRTAILWQERSCWKQNNKFPPRRSVAESRGRESSTGVHASRFSNSSRFLGIVSGCSATTTMPGRPKIQRKPLRPSVFDPLDLADPVHANRYRRRQVTVRKGKETAGYVRYRQLVPRDERQRGMPQTPNPRLDIPAKRWEGLVRAWRIRLHEYDPPDLKTQLDVENDLVAEQQETKDKEPDEEVGFNTGNPDLDTQLREAMRQGLLVDLAPMTAGPSPSWFALDDTLDTLSMSSDDDDLL